MLFGLTQPITKYNISDESGANNTETLFNTDCYLPILNTLARTLHDNNVKLFVAKPRITKKIEEEWSEAERPEADEIFFVIRGGAANNARCSWSERAGQ